jgi:hypothetical protein
MNARNVQTLLPFAVSQRPSPGFQSVPSAKLLTNIGLEMIGRKIWLPPAATVLLLELACNFGTIR